MVRRAYSEWLLPLRIAGEQRWLVALSCCPSLLRLHSASAPSLAQSDCRWAQLRFGYHDHYNNSYRVRHCVQPRPTPTSQKTARTITPTHSAIITTTHIASVTMCPRPTPTIALLGARPPRRSGPPSPRCRAVSVWRRSPLRRRAVKRIRPSFRTQPGRGGSGRECLRIVL